MVELPGRLEPCNDLMEWYGKHVLQYTREEVRVIFGNVLIFVTDFKHQ